MIADFNIGRSVRLVVRDKRAQGEDERASARPLFVGRTLASHGERANLSNIQLPAHFPNLSPAMLFF